MPVSPRYLLFTEVGSRATVENNKNFLKPA